MGPNWMRVARARRPASLSRPDREPPRDDLEERIYKMKMLFSRGSQRLEFEVILTKAIAMSHAMMASAMMKQKTIDHWYELQGSPGSDTFSPVTLAAIVLLG